MMLARHIAIIDSTRLSPRTPRIQCALVHAMTGNASLVLWAWYADSASIVPAALCCIRQHTRVKPPVVKECYLLAGQIQKRERTRLR